MTSPKTLTIDTREWNALLAHNAAELMTFFQQQPQPSPEAFKNIITYMDRMKEILPGWLASAPQPAAEPASQQLRPDAVPAPQANGAAPKARKKGGWPLGKPRTRKAAQAVQ